MIEAQHLILPIGEEKEISFRLPNGKRYGILGNASTALLDVMAGVSEANSGTMKLNGFDIQKEARIARSLLSYLPKDFSADPDLTVSEYLSCICGLYGVGGEKRIRRINSALEQTELDIYRNRPIQKLEVWDLPFLGIAQLLVTKAEFYLVNDPTSALAQDTKDAFLHLLLEASEGKTLFFASDDQTLLRSFCDEILTLEEDGSFSILSVIQSEKATDTTAEGEEAI